MANKFRRIIKISLKLQYTGNIISVLLFTRGLYTKREWEGGGGGGVNEKPDCTTPFSFHLGRWLFDYRRFPMRPANEFKSIRHLITHYDCQGISKTFKPF